MDVFSLLALGGVVMVLSLVALSRWRSTTTGGAGAVPNQDSVATQWRPMPRLKISTKKTGRTYAVVGGSGFLGSHIVEALLARGEEHIRIVDLREPSLFADNPHVEFIKANILKVDEIRHAVKGIDTVFHTAACLDYWSRLAFQRPRIYEINVVGAKNTLEACIKEGVKRFIFTSSSTVLLGAGESIRNGDESLPYPEYPNNHYGETKGIAEKAVLEANGTNGMLTAAVRPSGIFGPRDALLIGALVNNGKPEPLISQGNYQDWCYVENVVHSELMLESHLTDADKSPAGKAYCVAGDRKMEYEEFWRKANRALGGRDEDIVILPKLLVTGLAYVSEGLTWLSRGKLKGKIFTLTPSVLTIATHDLYFSHAQAKQDFGYEPPYTIEEALEQCRLYYRPEGQQVKIKQQ